MCPLESKRGANLVHRVSYHFTDAQRRRQTAHVRVFAPLGLFPGDELYLWGLLALTLSQQELDGSLDATPHWCLRQLGLIDAGTRRGGRQYQQFAATLERLSAVSYLSSACYDPVRCEYRQVSFRFFSYSLPANPESSRAWNIVWDEVFFRMVQAIGGSMRFDLELYRALDPAARRMFLLLTKVGYRKGRIPVFGLQHLAVDLLGLSPTLAIRDMKVKVSRTLKRLEAVGVIQSGQILRVAPGQFTVTIERGPALNSKADREPSAAESPLVESLLALGFDLQAASSLVRRYPRKLVALWTDITQAALERFGRQHFRKSPMAYLVDSLSKAAQGTRTPPDWWHEVRKAEQKSEQPAPESRELFSKLLDEVFGSERRDTKAKS
ncbi:MAG: hypothetical protein IAG10_12220, partial [Planctomycetaceae bacterium]|nr:hypothetical protein [Planctomycetaceae bacterium]